MSSDNGKPLSDYSAQVAAGTPLGELTDWSKVPDVITPHKQGTRGRKTKLATKKTARGWYPEETRIEAVGLYAALGSVAEVARVMKLNPATIRTWKCTEWWFEMMTRVHQEKDEELDSKFSKTIDLAMDEINDRLVNGEFVHNPKTGKTVRVKPKMRDIAYVSSTHIDKRQLLRGLPTTRSEKVDASDSLQRLAKEFAKFSRAKEVVHLPSEVVEDIEEC